MSSKPRDDWPPIIAGADRPAWVFWRGAAITALMWALFLYFLARELGLAWHGARRLAGRPSDPIDPGLNEFLSGAWPTAGIILVLVTVLGVSTLVSRRRHRAALLRASPAEVPDRELARDLGLTEQELHVLRNRTIVALDVDAQGQVVVQPDRDRSAVGAGD